MKIQRNNSFTNSETQAMPGAQKKAQGASRDASDSISTGRKLWAVALGALALSGGASARGLPNLQAAIRTPALPVRQSAGGNQGVQGVQGVASDLARSQPAQARAPLPAQPPAAFAPAPQPSASAPAAIVWAPTTAPGGVGAPEEGEA